MKLEKKMSNTTYYYKHSSRIFRANIFLLSLTLLISGCMTITGLEDGRSNGRGNHKLKAELGATQQPRLYDAGIDDEFAWNRTSPRTTVQYSYGVINRLDLGLRADPSLTFGAFGKLQIIGDKRSKFATAIGFDVSKLSIEGPMVYQVPFYMSFHPTSSTSIYFNPRYSNQAVGYLQRDLQSQIDYYGANAGILYGTKHQIGLDFGYHQARKPRSMGFLVSISMGGIFHFGD